MERIHHIYSFIVAFIPRSDQFNFPCHMFFFVCRVTRQGDKKKEKKYITWSSQPLTSTLIDQMLFLIGSKTGYNSSYNDNFK